MRYCVHICKAMELSSQLLAPTVISLQTAPAMDVKPFTKIAGHYK